MAWGQAGTRSMGSMLADKQASAGGRARISSNTLQCLALLRSAHITHTPAHTWISGTVLASNSCWYAQAV